ncbi:uncharacterized protein LOC144799468 [Lissotriton helveticus]
MADVQAKSKPKQADSTTPKMADVQQKTKLKITDSTTSKMADVPQKISKPAPSSTPSTSGPQKSKKVIEPTAPQKVHKDSSSKKAVRQESASVAPARTSKSVHTPSDAPTAPSTKRPVEQKSTTGHDPKAATTTHRHKDVGNAASAPKPTTEPRHVAAEESSTQIPSTPRDSDATGHRTSASTPSASFTKQVTDSLKRIREKTLSATAPTPSAPKEVDTPLKSSTKLIYTLPPKVPPKAFAPKSVPKTSAPSTLQASEQDSALHQCPNRETDPLQKEDLFPTTGILCYSTEEKEAGTGHSCPF